MLLLFAFGLLLVKGTFGQLSCPDLRNMNTKIKMEYLKAMGNEDVMECLGFLGKDPLDEDEAKFIWNVVVKVRGNVDEIPDADLKQLGWVVRAAETDSLANLTLSEVDTIAALGQYHNLSESQLEVLAERVLEDWADKQPSDYTNYDLAALKHILCGFNQSIIEAIHPDSYKDAAWNLATLQGCSQSALEALIGLAMRPEAFGLPSEWSSSQVKNVGCLLNGLSATTLVTIPPIGIESVTPDIMPCLYPETLKKMTSSQLLHLSPSAVGAMTGQQRNVLNREQDKAVAEAYEGLVERKDGAASHQLNSLVFIFVLVLSKLTI